MAATRSSRGARSTRGSRAAAAAAAAEAAEAAAEPAAEPAAEAAQETEEEAPAPGAAGPDVRAPSPAPAPAPAPAAPAAPAAPLLQQSRDFLDLFWGIAKPAQEERLQATAALVRRLREQPQEAELQYALKRLVEGLGATREAARPGFSLALSQVLQALEDVPLQSILDQIKEKHDLQRKKFLRNAAFGNFFGVLALFQSGRLVKDHKVLAEAVQLLQTLAQHRNHLQDLPRRTLVDIISEIPEPVFEEVLFSVLQADLTSAFSTPEQLHLLLVGLQKFPSVLQPKKLKKLLGSAAVVTKENVPRLVEVLNTAAKSVKKEKVLPPVGLDLLRVALQEGAFELLWKDVVESGLLQEHFGPGSYTAFRLLGSALPLMSLEQLHMVLRGEVMRRYGDHVLSAQLPSRFKFAPEMEKYVSSFLESCTDPEKQLAVLVAFSSLTNQGYPVVPSLWPVVKHLKPEALLRYSSWLQGMFLRPDLSSCLEFSTSRQKKNAAEEDESRSGSTTEKSVFRLRKWLIQRLISIVENPQVTKDEAFVMGISRFCFFHSFFETKKSSKDIPETEQRLSVPLDSETRNVTGNSFFSLLQTLNSLPLLGETPKTGTNQPKGKVGHGVMADGQLWTHHLVQYADLLLSHSKNVRPVKPFTAEEKAAWDRMLESTERLQQRAKDSRVAEITAFQQLLLLVGIHLLKAPAEVIDLLSDLQKCIEKALDKKVKKTASGAEEPHWVEVMVEVLLSLLSQPSRLIRQVSRSVFARICPHLTRQALRLILDVLDPDQEEDGAVVVTEESGKKKNMAAAGEDESEDNSASDGDSSDDGDESEDDADEAGEEVDSGFRQQLMNVLQAGKALDDGESSDEELDDEAMMALDSRLAGLFAEQKLRTQAKKHEKEKLQKEKNLRRDFKIKVLDLVEVFLNKQPENPLVLELLEPLLAVIERSMSTDSTQQEQEFLRKTADIFTNQLCRAKQYPHTVADQAEDIHIMLERLVQRASRQTDSSVAVYHFSASFYLLRVLKGNVPKPPAVLSPKKQRKAKAPPQVEDASCLDLTRVTQLYTEALTSFLSKRNSPFSAAMFVDLFARHPALCQQLVPVVLPFVTVGVRPYHQAQACVMILKALQSRELKQSLEPAAWHRLIGDSVKQTTESLKMVGEAVNKSVHLKMFKALELLVFLIKTVKEEKHPTSLEAPLAVLQNLRKSDHLGTTGRLSDLTWQALKLLGVQRPKEEKVRAPQNKADGAAPEGPGSRKRKKGFLPETKKRSKRSQEEAAAADSEEAPAPGEGTGKKRKRKRRKKTKQAQTPSGPTVNGTGEGAQPPSGTAAPPRSQAVVNGDLQSPAPGSAGSKKKHRAGKRKSSVDATPTATPLGKKAKLLKKQQQERPEGSGQ